MYRILVDPAEIALVETCELVLYLQSFKDDTTIQNVIDDLMTSPLWLAANEIAENQAVPPLKSQGSRSSVYLIRTSERGLRSFGRNGSYALSETRLIKPCTALPA